MTASSGRVGATFRKFLPLVGIAAFSVAVYLIYRALRRYNLADIIDSVSRIGVENMVLGVCFTAGSYLTLTWFDALGVRYVKRTVPYRKVALASFVALSLGHTIGFAALSSGAIRYRFYSSWGLKGREVAKIMLFCGTTVALGLVTLAGFICTFRPGLAAEVIGLAEPVAFAIGVSCLVLTGGYLATAALVEKPLTFRGWSIEMPSLRLALGQVAAGTLNYIFVSAVLHQMLSALFDIPFVAVASIYVLAIVAALISHVPGGLGVLEAVVLTLVEEASVIGALVAFRVVYYLMPLVLGSLLFAAYELARRVGKSAEP